MKSVSSHVQTVGEFRFKRSNSFMGQNKAQFTFEISPTIFSLCTLLLKFSSIERHTVGHDSDLVKAIAVAQSRMHGSRRSRGEEVASLPRNRMHLPLLSVEIMGAGFGRSCDDKVAGVMLYPQWLVLHARTRIISVR